MSTAELTISVTMLLEMYEDHVPCQYRHNPIRSVCSVEATHRIRSGCDGRSSVICTNAARIKLEALVRDKSCAKCDRPAIECWHLTEI